ncbi:MAG: hypothetical protein ACRCZ0_11035 [Cetobacterium sp.]
MEFRKEINLCYGLKYDYVGLVEDIEQILIKNDFCKVILKEVETGLFLDVVISKFDLEACVDKHYFVERSIKCANGRQGVTYVIHKLGKFVR